MPDDTMDDIGDCLYEALKGWTNELAAFCADNLDGTFLIVFGNISDGDRFVRLCSTDGALASLIGGEVAGFSFGVELTNVMSEDFCFVPMAAGTDRPTDLHFIAHLQLPRWTMPHVTELLLSRTSQAALP